ncbi:hypothetical protein K439DRAFT_1631469 [Ramaria rubella]|nr:hypothetical protein K439DRAFT_1631469 [Ramaria rubella]
MWKQRSHGLSVCYFGFVCQSRFAWHKRPQPLLLLLKSQLHHTMSDKLHTGQYYIRNAKTFAGRNIREDKLFNRKPVSCSTDADGETWILEALPNGRYKLKVRDAPTGVIDGLLFAFLIEEEKTEEWVITKREYTGHHALIETAAKDAGWISLKKGSHRYSRIVVSHPPFFPPNELWNIQPLMSQSQNWDNREN